MIRGKKCKFFFTLSRAIAVYCTRMAKGYPGDLKDTYLDGTLLGAAGGALSVFVEGIDQGIRAVSGRAYEAPQGIMGRTRRDISALFSHLGKGEFVKAATAAWSVVSGDIVMDGYDAVTGKRK